MKSINSANLPRKTTVYKANTNKQKQLDITSLINSNSQNGNSPKEHVHRNMLSEESINVDQLSTTAIKSGFDEKIIGQHILHLSKQSNGIELAIAYVAIMVKAKQARDKSLK